eukprot:1160936-Pelagomonas_calceolata.AAC.23
MSAPTVLSVLHFSSQGLMLGKPRGSGAKRAGCTRPEGALATSLPVALSSSNNFVAARTSSPDTDSVAVMRVCCTCSPACPATPAGAGGLAPALLAVPAAAALRVAGPPGVFSVRDVSPAPPPSVALAAANLKPSTSAATRLMRISTAALPTVSGATYSPLKLVTAGSCASPKPIPTKGPGAIPLLLPAPSPAPPPPAPTPPPPCSLPSLCALSPLLLGFSTGVWLASPSACIIWGGCMTGCSTCKAGRAAAASATTLDSSPAMHLK